jgi:hypothetical protein
MFLNYLAIAVDCLLDIYDLTVEPLSVNSEPHLQIWALREDCNPQRTLVLSRHEHQEREVLYHVVVVGEGDSKGERVGLCQLRYREAVDGGHCERAERSFGKGGVIRM